MNYWLFHGNPGRWRIFDYLRDHPDEDFQDWTWSAARYVREIEEGDAVAFWLTGSPTVRGVYALGRVTGPPSESTGWSEYATDPADRRRGGWQVPMAFDHIFFNNPVLAVDLREDSRFAQASILRMPRAGNPHRLEEDEWRAIAERAPES